MTLLCGTCIHFQRGPAHEKFEALCKERGIRDYNAAPEECYSPDPMAVTRADVDVHAVGKLCRQLNGDQMRVLGQLMTQAADLEAIGLKFGQPMYVNLGNGPDGLDYLTSYFLGYIVGMTHVKVDKTTTTPHVYLASDLSFGEDQDLQHRTLLRMMPSSLLTKAQFNVRRAMLVEAGRMEAPVKGWKMPLGQWLKSGCPMPAPDMPHVYEPPTLDTAPISWQDPFSVEELETVKKVSRRSRHVSEKELPEEVARKRALRAAAREKLKTTTLEDGTVVVSAVALKEWAPVAMPAAVR